MRITFATLGCKLNQAESDEIKALLKKKGCIIVPFGKPADIAIVRACAVTINASQTARRLIRRAKKAGCYVIAGGCLENTGLPEIDFTARNDNDIVGKIVELNSALRNELAQVVEEQADKTRALIKIQTGCNFNCAYCVIPEFRGKSQSMPADIIINRIRQGESKGYNEIVLTGVNICQYKDGRTDLTGLIKLIIEKTKILRIRLGSLDPRLITTDFIKLYRDKRLMPHWHLSLQSGSDSVLKRMGRGYSVAHYLDLIRKVRRANHFFSITTDIIVGFPGESEKEFMDTLVLVKKVRYAKIHVFPYSVRPNTSAGRMMGQIRDRIKTERIKRLIITAGESSKQFATNFINKTREILFENMKNGYWTGYSPEYLPIRYKSKRNLKNKIASLKLTKQMLAN